MRRSAAQVLDPDPDACPANSSSRTMIDLISYSYPQQASALSSGEVASAPSHESARTKTWRGKKATRASYEEIGFRISWKMDHHMSGRILGSNVTMLTTQRSGYNAYMSENDGVGGMKKDLVSRSSVPVDKISLLKCMWRHHILIRNDMPKDIIL